MHRAWVAALLVAALTAPGHEGRQDAAWWIASYGVLTPERNPLAARATEVFSRVVAAADKKGRRFPRLVLLGTGAEPFAGALPDGSVLVSPAALELCYASSPRATGDALLAFVLAHELAHLSQDEFRHAESGMALGRLTFEAGEEAAGARELRADALATVTMAIAGHDPRTLLGAHGGRFFQRWYAAGSKKPAERQPGQHPTSVERAARLRSEIASTLEELPYFHVGTRLAQLGRSRDAIAFLERFRDRFPSREVFGNLGASYLQLAYESLSRCDRDLVLRFELPLAVDDRSLAERLRSDRPEGCRSDPETAGLLREAVRHLRQATLLDEGYVPARLNLASALLVQGEPALALGETDVAVRGSPQDPAARTLHAVALYAFGIAGGIDAADRALHLLEEVLASHPTYRAAAFNQARILKERGRLAAARAAWRVAAGLGPRDAFGDAAWDELGLPPEEGRAPVASPRSPIPMGESGSRAVQRLSGMTRRPFALGDLRATLHTGGDTTVLEIDHSVELVERGLATPRALSSVARGAPLRVFQSPAGRTLVFRDFAVDLVGDSVVRLVYFEPER